MADTPSVLPAGAKPTAPTMSAGEQTARIIALPDKLSSNPRGVRIEGEVVRQNNDGSTRIRTDAGTIDIQLRGKQPDVGQRVQIDIPAGNPPRQVTVRPAPEQAQQPPTPQPAPTPGQTAPVAQQPAPARPIPAPVQPLPPSGATTPLPVVTQPLPEQATVRLIPAQPAQVQAAIQQTLNSVATLPAAVSTTAYTATLVAQAAPDNLVTQLINNVLRPMAPLIATPPTPALATLPPMAAAPLPSAGFLSHPVPLAGQTPAINAPILSAPTPLPSTLSAAILPMPAVSNGPAASVPFQPMSAFLTPAVPTDLAVPGKITTMLDVLVTKIIPPGAQITAPPASSTILLTPAIPGQTLVQTQGQMPLQAPHQTPGVLTATVIGTMPQGQPIISLPIAGGLPQSFILQFPASNLPIGAQIQMIPQPGQAVTSPTSPVTAPPLTQPLPLLMTGSRWPVLNDLLQTLQQAEPDLAQTFTRALPSPASPRSIPSAAMLFMAAAKANDMATWLGEKKVELLQRLGRSSLLGRLTGDGQQVAKLSADPISNSDWRALPLPMFWDQEIHKITLYFKRDSDANSQENNQNEQARFVFDLSLSRIGDVQIDGLSRGQRLDLIVRSHSPFSQPMMAHMRQLYNDALDGAQLHGDLSFQGDPRQWVHVLSKEEQYQAQI